MTTLRSQVLLILAVMCGALLTAKTLVDFSRAEPRIVDEARAQGRVALLQAGPLVERAYGDGHLSEVRRVLAQLAAIPGARHASLLGAQGTVLAANDVAREGAWAAGARAAGAVLDLAHRAGGGFDVAGQTLLAAAPVRLAAGTQDPLLTGPPMPSAGTATLVLELDLAERLAFEHQAILVENGLATAVVIVVLFLIGLLLEVRFARPARRVVETIEKFRAGERSARTDLKGQHEIARIAKTFDRMAERVQAEENEILDVQVRLERVLKALPVGVMVVRRDDGKPFYVNPRWRDLFGIPMDASRDILSLLSTVRCERPDGSPYPIEQLPIPTVLRTGRPAVVRDLRVRRDDMVVALVASAVPVSLAGSTSFDAVVALAAEADLSAPGDLAVFVGLGIERLGAAAGPMAPDASVSASVPGPASVPAPVSASIPAAASAPPPALAESDRETVLVAEGDAATLDLAQRTLEMAGYRVLAATEGERAMVLFGREGPRVRAVVLDLGLRGPSGEMLLDEILALDPTTRVIAASGYRPDLPTLAASGKVTAFLTRPYGAERLRVAVRHAMEAGVGVGNFPGA